MEELRLKILKLLESDIVDDEVDRRIDEIFGIDYHKIEESITEHKPGSYSYEKIEPEALYTSYRDFWNLMKSLPLNDDSSFVDMGAGVGRSKLLYSVLNPKIKTQAIEFIPQRINAGRKAAEKFGLPTEGFIQADIRHHPLPLADYYFLYLPTGRMIERLFLHFKEMAKTRKVTILAIESHGDLIDSLVQDYPWLQSESLGIKTVSDRHRDFIYRFISKPQAEVKRYCEEERSWFLSIQKELEEKGIFEWDKVPEFWRHPMIKYFAFFEDYEFMIRDHDVDSTDEYTWLASTFQTRLSPLDDHYDSTYPGRTFHKDQIIGLYLPDKKYSKWRELRFKNEFHGDKGQVRKIIFEPVPLVEFSNGERIGLV